MRLHSEAQKIDSPFRRGHMRLVGMQAQSCLPKVLGNGIAILPHLRSTVTEQHKVVTVPHISRYAERLANVVVERIEEDVGEKLAGQIPNRKPCGTQPGKQIDNQCCCYGCQGCCSYGSRNAD